MSIDSLIRSVGTEITFQRGTDVSDDMGGYTKTWATLFSRVSVRLQPMKAQEVIRDDKDTVLANYKMYTFVDYRDVTEADRVAYYDSVEGSWVYFRIHWKRNPDMMNHHLRFDLLRIE